MVYLKHHNTSEDFSEKNRKKKITLIRIGIYF